VDDFHRGLITQVHCYECNALYDRIACPVCGHVIEAEKVRQPDGSYVERRTVPGALGWSTHLLLEMMRREWERADDGPAPMGKTSRKLVIVILFWTFFESLMDRFYHAALGDLDEAEAAKILRKFKFVGGQLDELHKSLWGVSFWEDLAALDYLPLAQQIRTIQERRNAFIHGDPEAIDDSLVAQTMGILMDVQFAWIKLFNTRCTHKRRKIPIWHQVERAAKTR